MCYLEVTISTWAGGTALGAKPGESSRRALYPFLQPFLALSQGAFQNPGFFLKGPSQWTFPRPLGRSWMISPAHAHTETSSWESCFSQHKTFPVLISTGSPLSSRSRGTDRSWHISLPKTPSPGPKRHLENLWDIIRAPPSPKMNRIKKKPWGFFPHLFLALMSTLWSCFFPLLIGLFAAC